LQSCSIRGIIDTDENTTDEEITKMSDVTRVELIGQISRAEGYIESLAEISGGDIDMTVCEMIQRKIADWSAQGHDIFDDESAAAPYTECFYDNCFVFWEEAGFDRLQVAETVTGAIAELKKVYA
jgi:hypothetical protein